MEKIADLAIKTGTYEKNGETKNRYENIGAVMKGDNGQFLILKRTFSPAGVPNPENRDTCIVSIFKKKKEEDKPSEPQEEVTW